VPINIGDFTVTFTSSGTSFAFLLGNLDPVDTLSGIFQRLQNLGYIPHEVDVDTSDLEPLRRALRRFRDYNTSAPKLSQHAEVQGSTRRPAKRPGLARGSHLDAKRPSMCEPSAISEKSRVIGDPSGPQIDPVGPTPGQYWGNPVGQNKESTDPVEYSLAKALEAAAAAGHFEVVMQLARELEARRLARIVDAVGQPISSLIDLPSTSASGRWSLAAPAGGLRSTVRSDVVASKSGGVARTQDQGSH